MSNILRSIIDISRTKMYYYIFFKIFFNKSILRNQLKRIKFLNFTYKKKDLNFYKNKTKKKKEYY